MDYTAKIGDRSTQAHINYRCPCGCVAGITYDRVEGPEHLGMCCCGRLLWVGPHAVAVLRTHYAKDREYQVESGEVTLPWGEKVHAVLAVPVDAVAAEQAKREAGKVPTKVVDPVCGMMFDPDTAAAMSSYQGSVYYFCAVSCKTKFDANPKNYVQTKGLIARLRKR